MSFADKNDDWKSRRFVVKDEDSTSESGDSKNEAHSHCPYNDDIDHFLHHVACLVRHGDYFAHHERHMNDHDCAHESEREIELDVCCVLDHPHGCCRRDPEDACSN